MKKNTEHTEAEISPDELNSLVEAQGDVISEQAEKITALEQKIEALSAAVPATRPVARRGSFKLKGKEYAILHGVQVSHEGMLRTVTPADIEREVELQELLIALESGAIKQIV